MPEKYEYFEKLCSSYRIKSIVKTQIINTVFHRFEKIPFVTEKIELFHRIEYLFFSGN